MRPLHRVRVDGDAVTVDRPDGDTLSVVAGDDAWQVFEGALPRATRPFGAESAVAVLLGRRLRSRAVTPCLVAMPGELPGPLVVSRVASLLAAVRDTVLARRDPELPAFWRAVEAVHSPPPRFLLREAPWRDRWLLRDVLRYRAAAIAVGYLGTALHPGEPGAGQPTPVELLARWRDLFSPTRTTYRSLDRTLMQLPRAVSPALVCRLATVRLVRPMTEALELAALLTGATVSERVPGGAAWLVPLLHHARAAEIADAVDLVAGALARPLFPTNETDLAIALRYVADCPDPGGGRLPAVTARAVRWHRDGGHDEADGLLAALADLPPDLPLPRVSLPDEPGITFLGTVAAVIDEGRRMEHCVSGYALLAAAGMVHIFHVEHGGEAATVAIDPWGRVEQAAGPRNTTNRAAAWGTWRLGAWGAALRRRPAHGQDQLELFPTTAI